MKFPIEWNLDESSTVLQSIVEFIKFIASMTSIIWLKGIVRFFLAVGFLFK